MTSTDPHLPPVPLEDLAATWHGLGLVAAWYEVGGPGWRALIEARRLVEVEMRAQHGDDAWLRITS